VGAEQGVVEVLVDAAELRRHQRGVGHRPPASRSSCSLGACSI
jgi:hypothetical protein